MNNLLFSFWGLGFIGLFIYALIYVFIMMIKERSFTPKYYLPVIIPVFLGIIALAFIYKIFLI